MITVRIQLDKVKCVRSKPSTNPDHPFAGMTVYFKEGGKRHYTGKWLRDNEVIFLKPRKKD